MNKPRGRPRKAAPKSNHYWDLPPSRRQLMKLEDKVRDLDYQPGVFALEVLDTKPCLNYTRARHADNWTHNK